VSAAPGETPHRAWLPVTCAILTGVQVGASMVATRAVVDELDPLPMTFVRYVIGAIVLLPITVRTMQTPFRRADLASIAALGVVQFGVLILLLTMGLERLPAAQGSLVFSTSPLFAMILAIAMGQEGWSGRRLAGIALALGGLAIALRPGLAGDNGSRAGVALVTGAAICAALTGVWSRPLVRRYGALPVSAVAMVATVVALAIPAFATSSVGDVIDLDGANRLWLLLLGLGSGLGYVMWLYALRWLGTSTVTAFLLLGPPTALLLGAVFVDDPLAVSTVLGMAIVAAGLWVTTRARATVPPPTGSVVRQPVPGSD
jgi:drug/metabolite transporter (DMT)-like permease